MPFRCYFMRCDKYIFYIFRDFGNVLDCPPFGNHIHKFRAIKSSFLCHFFEEWMNFYKFIVIQNIPNITYGEKRFYTTWTACYYTYSSRGCHSGYCSISYFRRFRPIIYTSEYIGKGSPLFCKVLRSAFCFYRDKLHNIFRCLYALFGIIGYAQLYEHIGKSHHSKSYFSVVFCHFLYGF